MQTNQAKKQRPRETFVYVLFLIAVFAVVFALCVLQAMHQSKDAERRAIRRAVLSRAVQCASIEGSYPQDVNYLERNYGLRYNHDRYIVIYEPMGDNVTPQVTVVEKK